MQSNHAINFLPSIQADKKMEVSLEGDEAILKLSTWTENIGWNCQKTMRLDSAMLDDLHRAISAARYRLTQRKAESGTEVGTAETNGNVISFPLAA